tara:strand:- start:466 stop:783 length:318 start_codon:yes stop_codon:yes gene_type:complete
LISIALKIKEFIKRILGIGCFKISIDDSCAAVIINQNEIEVVMSDKHISSASGISTTIGYIVYAIDRHDWISEYIAHLDSEIEKARTSEEEEKRKAKYSHLTLVE